jgi:hypothetical protein
MITKATITEEETKKMIEKFNLTPWSKNGQAPRYYLNLDVLEKLIGLEQDFYKSGNVSSCFYKDSDGDEVSVANSRAYGRGYMSHKTYISENTVVTTWNPYDVDMAAEIANRIHKI